MRWIVTAATPVELSHVPPDHPAVLGTVVTGAGKTASAVAVTAALARVACRMPSLNGVGVLNVGTAGSLDGRAGGVARPSRAWAWDLDAASLTALGIPVEDEVALDGGDGSVIATGDRFVCDAALARTLAGRAGLVDMECYAVALAARSFGVPVRAVKWISDPADESAASLWGDAAARGAAELRDAVLDALEGDHCPARR